MSLCVKGRKDMSHYNQEEPKFINEKPSKLKESFRNGFTTFIVIVLGVILYFCFLRADQISQMLGEIWKVLTPIIYGLVLAFLLNPIVKIVDKRVYSHVFRVLKKERLARKITRSVGIFVSLLFTVIVITALFNMMIPELYKSIYDLIVSLPEQMEQMGVYVNQILDSNTTLDNLARNFLGQLDKTVRDFIQNQDLLSRTNDLMSGVTAGVIGAVNIVTNILVGVIVSVYVLFSKEAFVCQTKKILYALFKANTANTILHIAHKTNVTFTGFIIGKIIDSAIIGVLCFIGVSILNMPYTLLVSVIVGVTNVIPFFGPYIGAIPCTILIFLVNPMQGLYFVLFILALQQLDGNVIGPKILGDSTGLSSFWVIFAIVVGGGLFGVAGMIMGVPTFAVLYYIAKTLINQKLEKKKLPVESFLYLGDNYVDEDGTFVSIENDEREDENADTCTK